MNCLARKILAGMTALALIAALLLTGCSAPPQKSTGDLMKTLPADTDALFIFNYEEVSRVPELLDIWEGLVDGVLPDNAAPYKLGMASRQGLLSSLLFAFEKKPGISSLFSAKEYPNRHIYNRTEIVSVEYDLDAFIMDDMLVMVLMDDAETFLDEAANGLHSMHDNPVYKHIVTASLDGAMVFIVENATVTGLPVVLGMAVSVDEDSSPTLSVSGIVDYGDKMKAEAVSDTIEGFLSAKWALTGISATQDEGVYRVNAQLDLADFGIFLSGITEGK